MIGFPGAIAVHREDIVRYRDKEYPLAPLGIADLS
jgi:gluconate 2-dehydrogenase gamma chain